MTSNSERLYYLNPALTKSGDNIINGQVFSATSSSTLDDIYSGHVPSAYRLFNHRYNWKQLESGSPPSDYSKTYGDSGNWSLHMKKVEEKEIEGTLLDTGDGQSHLLGYPWVQYNFPKPVRLEEMEMFFSNASVIMANNEVDSTTFCVTHVIVCGRNGNEQQNVWTLLNAIPTEEKIGFTGISSKYFPGQSVDL